MVSTTTVLLIILIILLFGGFVDINGRGLGYGFGPAGVSLPGLLLLVLIVLLVTGRL
jgi:hypothetical protein